MTTILLFIGLQLLASIIAIWRGGAPERWVAGLLAAALLAGHMIPYNAASSYHTVNWPLLWIDLSLWLSLSSVALLADRYWPMWLAALQLVALAGHGVRGYDPSIVALAYWWATNKIGWLILGGLIWGIARHAARRRAGLPEFAWTFQRDAAHERADDAARPR